MMDGDGMATIAEWLKVDGEDVARNLLDITERLHAADGEVVLDLSSVTRVDPGAVTAIDRLADRAEEKAVRVVLRGVNVEVYKVLKLVKLAPRFSFLD